MDSSPIETQSDRLLTLSDLAQRFGVATGTIYQWRRRGFGPPAIKVGHLLRFDPKDVEDWLLTQRR